MGSTPGGSTSWRTKCEDELEHCEDEQQDCRHDGCDFHSGETTRTVGWAGTHPLPVRPLARQYQATWLPVGTPATRLSRYAQVSALSARYRSREFGDQGLLSATEITPSRTSSGLSQIILSKAVLAAITVSESVDRPE